MQESSRSSNDSVSDEYATVSPKKPIDVSDETFAHNGSTADGGSLTSEHDRLASNGRTSISTASMASTSGKTGRGSTSKTLSGNRTSTTSARSGTTVTVNKVSQRRHTIDFCLTPCACVFISHNKFL